MRAPGGFALEDHWADDGRPGGDRSDGRYDVVVLQQGPTSLPESRVNLLEWGRTFSAAIRAAGARPAFFTVWPESWRSSAFDAVDLLVPCGRPRQRRPSCSRPGSRGSESLRANPALELYGPDGFHPSRLGTYLAAVTIASGLTGTPAVGMERLGVAPRTAAILQRAAAAALRAP